MKQMKKQQGFTIVVVLLLSMMASVVVISSLKDTTMQERLSGNFEKQTNARLAAESGLFSTHSHLEAELAKVPTTTLTQLIASKGEGGKFTYAATNKLEGMLANIELSQTSDGLLSVASGGERFEGEKQLRALYELVPGIAGTYAFEQFLVGCSGVTVAAGGSAVSYDSTDSSKGYGTKANISTLNKDSDIVINGGGLVWGDVNTTRNIEVLAGTVVAGKLHANGNVKVSGGGGAVLPSTIKSGTRVTKDILAGGNVEFVGGVNGVVKAIGDLKYGSVSSTFIDNNNSEPLALMYGGNLLSRNDISDTPKDSQGTPLSDQKFKVKPLVPVLEAVDPNNIAEKDKNDPKKSCDFLEISTELAALKLGEAIPDLNLTSWGAKFVFTPSIGKYVSGGTSLALSSKVKTVFNKSANVFFINDLNISGSRLIFKKDSDSSGRPVSGEQVIHVFINGNLDYSASGGPNEGSLIEIQEGVAVVFYIMGSAVFKKAFAPQSVEGLRTQLKMPSLTIYSAYNKKSRNALSCQGSQGPWGVEMSGTGNMYGVIYSPYSDVKIGSSTVFKGAIRANTITACGSGQVIYDEALATFSTGNGTVASPAKLVFKGWRYHAEADQLATSSTR